MRLFLIAAGLLLAACSGPDDPEAAREVAYQKALSAAATQARSHLAYFWTHEQAPTDTEYDFRLKIALPHHGQPGGAEVWLDSVARDGDRLSGQLAAETPDLPQVKRGDIVEFSEPQITDWAFFSGEKLYGHYTTRVMLPRLPPEQADAMRSMFADNPK